MVLREDVLERNRELLIQVCEAEEIKIKNGVASPDHVQYTLNMPLR